MKDRLFARLEFNDKRLYYGIQIMMNILASVDKLIHVRLEFTIVRDFSRRITLYKFLLSIKEFFLIALRAIIYITDKIG